MKKTLKKISLRLFAATIFLMALSKAKADSEGNCPTSTWYSGFSMANVDQATGYTLSASATLTTGSNGLGGSYTLSGGVSGIFMRCCMGSSAGSACNFANELGGSEGGGTGTTCSNSAVRPAHNSTNQLCL